MYGDYFNLNDGKKTIVSYDVNEDLESSDDELIELNQEGTIGGVLTIGRTKTTRLEREMNRLNTSYNPVVEEVTEMAFAFVGITSSGYNEPQSFNEGWNHVDDVERKGWQGAIQKEFQNMLEKNVWTKKERKNMAVGRHLVGSKWAFKKKKSGLFCACLVALGYNQIPGVDYSDNFAPVINDVSLRLVILL